MTEARLIAHTYVDFAALEDLGYKHHGFDESGEPEWWADEIAEFAGRGCYLSYDRPNPKTAANKDYLAHIIEVGHESVLEHASATFHIRASRSVLAELTRHRHLSFSVVSQRYVDADRLSRMIPPAIGELEGDAQERAIAAFMKADAASRSAYKEIVQILDEAGKPRKKAREAARSVVINATDSPMVVTGNMRAWRYVIKARWHEAADAEIRELAGIILEELREIAPNCFQDIPAQPYSY